MVLKSVSKKDQVVEMTADGYVFKVTSAGSLQFEREYEQYTDADTVFEMLATVGDIEH